MPPPPPWPAKEARRQPSPLLKTPRCLIEGQRRQQAPVQDPPWIWREAAGDQPPDVAPQHQVGKLLLPPPDQALAGIFNQSPSPPRPARSRRRGGRRSLMETTKALLWRLVEVEAP
jgi:hypothetical protein